MPVYAEKNDGDPEDNKRVQFDNRDIKLADLSANHKELGYEFNKKQFHDAKGFDTKLDNLQASIDMCVWESI